MEGQEGEEAARASGGAKAWEGVGATQGGLRACVWWGRDI